MRFREGVIALAAAMSLASPASGEDAPVTPRPASEPLYGVHGPVSTYVDGVDGDRLRVDTWLPATRDGHVPPEHVPVVVQYGPYFTPGERRGAALEQLVTRGYAFAQAHVPGTGGSTGCFAQGGATEQADGARIVDHLGRRAPYSDGHVALMGMSYTGGTALEVAASPERELIEPLDAVVSLSPVASLYDFFFHDGVPHMAQAPASTLFDTVVNGFDTGREGAQAAPAERLECQGEQLAAVADTSGDLTPFYRARDLRRHVRRITVPTFMAHGHPDGRVSSRVQAGLFDRIPADVPHTGLFGFWGHVVPPIAEFDPMVVAWFDRWLKGLDTGVERWPAAQVQAVDGSWYARPRWPRTGRRAGRVELSPVGSPSYVESVPELRDGLVEQLPGSSASFVSVAQPSALALDGMPRLDVRVSLTAPDAHLAAELEVLGPGGGRTQPAARVIGMRSLRHLEPYRRGRFVQARGRPAPVGRPVDVRLRFDPTSLVVPAGGRLRLTLSGSVIAYDGLEGAIDGGGELLPGPSQPSFASPQVTVVGNPTLRFTQP